MMFITECGSRRDHGSSAAPGIPKPLHAYLLLMTCVGAYFMTRHYLDPTRTSLTLSDSWDTSDVIPSQHSDTVEGVLHQPRLFDRESLLTNCQDLPRPASCAECAVHCLQPYA